MNLRLLTPMPIMNCIRHFKRSFIKKHISKHGKWPKSSLEAGCPRAMSMPFIYNRDPDAFKNINDHGSVDINDYNFVNIEKCEEF